MVVSRGAGRSIPRDVHFLASTSMSDLVGVLPGVGVDQGFPNWGTRTPGGTREDLGGYATGFSKYFDFD